MIIALDYDHTYTLDPVAWNSFISTMMSRGHKVVVVTYRDERYDAIPAGGYQPKYLGLPIEVYYTAGVAKKWYMTHFGVPVDVWIDDKPETVLENSRMSPDQLKAWRKHEE